MKIAVPQRAALGVAEALGNAPMCGGCAAKVGRGALLEALAAMPKYERGDIQSVAGDDAAIMMTGGVRQVISTDHLRAFTLDPVAMTRIAALHALGDIWAMGAKPQAATATLILPRMSADLQARTTAEIMQVASEVMSEAGAAIVGGHSSLGAELTIGFTVTGICTRDPITISGAKDGDLLVLTKPIGTGVILAAEMAGQARGRHVVEAFETMQQSQAAASEILCGAHAMTDVTGFGLAGHLGGICEASGVSSTLWLDKIPILNGALNARIRSSLFEDNCSGSGPVFGATGQKSDLLFDPQTAGGLLASVSPQLADKCVTELRNAGYPAVIIGEISNGPAQVTVLESQP